MKARHFQAIKHFIDDTGILNDGGEFNDVYKDIYPPELELKVERSGTHATFLNLDITVKDGMFIYKLFNKSFFLSFTCLTLIVIYPKQYFIWLLFVNFLG